MTEPTKGGSALSSATAKENAVQAAALERARRQRAAREHAALQEPVAVPTVKARVTHKGDGLVSTGQHVGGIGEVYYEKGEIIEAVPEPSALELQERGLVEIV